MFKLSSFSSSTRSQSFSPLLHFAVDNALTKTFPLVHDALAKFFNICNLPLIVDPLLHDSPYRIVYGVKIRTIGRPQTWLDEIRSDFFQQLDHLASSVSWRSILLEDEIFRILPDFQQQISGQQHFTIVLSMDFHSCVNKVTAGSSQSGQGNTPLRIARKLAECVRVAPHKLGACGQQVARKRGDFDCGLALQP